MIDEVTISVVIPAYNAGATICRAVDSVLAQTESAHEIIVVDDGSADDLAQVVERYGSRVRCIRQPNGGAASARNRGIEEATGNVIAFLDADDYWEPIKLNCQAEIFRRYPQVGLVASRFYEEPPGQTRYVSTITRGPCEKVLECRGEQAFLLGCGVWTGTIAVRRSVIDQHRFTSEFEPAEDRDMWIRLVLGTSVYVLTDSLATYVLEPGSLSRSDVQRDYSSMLRVVQQHKSLLSPRALRRWKSRVLEGLIGVAIHQMNYGPAYRASLQRLQVDPCNIVAWWALFKSGILNVTQSLHASHAALPDMLPNSAMSHSVISTIDDHDGRQSAAPDTVVVPQVLSSPVVKNAFWNWLGTGIELTVALLLTPFLIRRLGDSAYGAWIVMGSLTGYLGVLDFGLRGSVGRHVAYYHARNDREGLLRTLNTAGFTMALLGAVGLAIMVVFSWHLDWLANVPANLLPEAQTAMLIVGVHLALWFVTKIFDAMLWGYQRFDLLNKVDIPFALFRGVASAIVIVNGDGLVGLAGVTLAMTIGVGLAKMWLCHRVEPRDHISLAHIRRSALRELGGYGFWNFLVSLGIMARTQLSPVAVGATLGLAIVTPFSVALRLVATASTIITSGTGVLTPFATALHARDDHGRQRMLFLESGKFCVGAAIFFVSLFVLLGKSLLSLWIGPELEWAWEPLVILICGELAPMSVMMASNTILGMAKNRSLAIAGIAECATALVVALLLCGRFELNGVCAGLAIAATCWRGVFVFSRAARLVELPFHQFLTYSTLPMLAAAVVPVGLLTLATWFHRPANWIELCLFTGVFTALYGSLAMLAIWGVAGVQSRFSKWFSGAGRVTAQRVLEDAGK